MSAYRSDSWALKATFWRDLRWQSETLADAEFFSSRPLRSRAGRYRRWETEIASFCATLNADWTVLAADKELWSKLAADFTTWVWK